MATPIQTDEIGGIKIPKPQSNMYQSSVATSDAAVRSDTEAMSHNVFRPDIYRVSEGYMN